MEARDAVYSSKGYQQLAVSSVAVALTVPQGARYAWLKVETNSIRWRDDGVDPTTSVGMPWSSLDETFFVGDIKAFRAIRQSSDAVLNITYYQ